MIGIYGSNYPIAEPKIESYSIDKKRLNQDKFKIIHIFKKKGINNDILSFPCILQGYFFYKGKIISSSDDAFSIYDKYGLKCISNIITGKFLFLVIDNNKIVMVNDRFGLYPFYYFFDKSKGNFIFAPSQRFFSSCNLDLTLDASSLAEYIFIDYPVGNKTFFNEIQLMPPASIMVYNIKENKLSIEKYWHPKYNPSVITPIEISKSLMDAIKLIESLGQRYNSPICTNITGGLDTRVVYALSNHTKILGTYTGSLFSSEIKIAKKIIKDQRDKHLICKIDSTKFLDSIKKFAVLSDGLVSSKYFPALIYNEFLRKNGINMVMGGFVGDGLFGGTFFSRLSSGGIHTDIIPKNRCFSPNFWNLLINSLQRINISADKKNGNQIDRFMLFEGKIRKSLRMLDRVAENFVEKMYPFLDYRVFDKYLKVPIDDRFWHKIYIQMFKQDKKLQQYQQQNTVTIFPLWFPYSLQKKMMYISKFLNWWFYPKFEKIFGNRSSGKNFGKWLFDDKEWLECFLLEGLSYQYNLINKSYVQKVIGEHCSTNLKNYTKQLLKLIDLEMWCKNYGNYLVQ